MNVYNIKAEIWYKLSSLNNFLLTGTAIYPTLALLNHSCDPNITKYFDGKKVIVVAGKKIRKGKINSWQLDNTFSHFHSPLILYIYLTSIHFIKIVGDEVTENYFPYYPFIATEDRTKWLLKHYCFDCK